MAEVEDPRKGQKMFRTGSKIKRARPCGGFAGAYKFSFNFPTTIRNFKDDALIRS